MNTLLLPRHIRAIGFLAGMDVHEQRKLGIFNLLNALGFLIGILLPITGLFITDIELPFFAWIIAFSPAMVSMIVLILNHFKKYESAILCYFTLYPLLTALVYQVSFDVGVELFFILYGVLSVFFLQRFAHVAFAFSLSMICYFYVFVFTRNYEILMVEINFPFYIMSHVLPAGFIFYALFLIKRENSVYQKEILMNNQHLRKINDEIRRQKSIIDEKAKQLEDQNRIIDEKARLLEKQTLELKELNTMKSKLFSVISHDLKAPLYALRNLFKGVQQYDLPAEEIKKFIPDVIKDLNFTTSLMENLLIWARSQMQISVLQPHILELSELAIEVTEMLRLQAASKGTTLIFNPDHKVYVYSDKDMISLVIRNLVSNAIKFSKAGDEVVLSIEETEEYIEFFVQDTGVGMSPEAVTKILERNYFTTQGTAKESGTGLGLMLCSEFITLCGGQLKIKSTPGVGSTFSFVIPRKVENAMEKK